MTNRRVYLPNVGPNRGRALAGPIKNFVHRLVGTVKNTTGVSYRELDKMLGFPTNTDSITESYVTLNSRRARGVQAASVQSLENRVAKFLGRPAFKVVVRNLGTGTNLLNLSGNMEPLGAIADYKPPRSSDDEFAFMDSRGLIMVGYEFLPDHVFMGFGENVPPSEDDVIVYRSQIERAAAAYQRDHRLYAETQTLATHRLAWLDDLSTVSAGNLPETCAEFA